MYKIKSNVGELKVLIQKYFKQRQERITKEREEYINLHLNDKSWYGAKKFNSREAVVNYMKNTDGDLWSTIWDEFELSGRLWFEEVKVLFENIQNLPDDREIWLEEELNFLFTYKDK